MLIPVAVQCPYCGETFETSVDGSVGSQEYIEDCQVCCRPIVLRYTLDDTGNLDTLSTRRDHD
jgi:hypothetical protein